MNQIKSKTKIIVSSGDVNGIGLEVFLKGISTFLETSDSEVSLCINPNVLKKYAELCDFNIKSDNNLNFKIIDTGFECKINLGKQTKESGMTAKKSIEMATGLLLDGEYDAIVTLPISKKAVQMAGWQFPGHTEYFASLFTSLLPGNHYNMILTHKNMRVIPLTIHEPIKNIPNLITQELIINKIKSFNNSLFIDFAIKKPKIAVLGLNPHAGENGSIGIEEINIINPAIKMLQNAGIDASGTFPSDGFFGFGEYKKYDGIVSMYHDQGLIPLKLLSNGAGVNITSGLPIIRTSPDHGTGFAIAGKGQANADSFVESMRVAEQIFLNRKI